MPAAWTAILIAATSTTTLVADDFPGALRVALSFEPIVLDYELPGHPNTFGRGHVGIVSTARLIWLPNAHVEIEVGVLGRLPFALDLEDEPAALPIVSVTGKPFGEALLMRFGSLDTRHGYHGAIVDEARFRYGRDVQETYNRSIPADARRDLGGDPFPPGEHGAQLIATTDLGRVELFLDWQLLETEAHREKFNFGILGEINTDWFDVALQFRLTHYGGQLFTKGDPIRDAGLDPVRQPETMGITATAHPVDTEYVDIDVNAAFIGGEMRQVAGGPESWHYGVEGGLDLHLFDLARLGYRVWHPRDNQPGFVSEDGDPVYRAARSHRATLALNQRYGGLEIDGKLDLVFQEGSDKVQYLAVTSVAYRWEGTLFRLDAQSAAATQ